MTAVVAGMLIAATPVFAADVQPPLQALRHQNYTLVVAERLDRPVVDGKMPVRVIKPLRGDMDSAGEMEILVLEGDEEIVDAGVRYLLFYSDVERVSFKPRTEVRRPDRRKLLHIEGADPAVYPDTLFMRSLFDPGHVEVEQSDDYREIVMRGLRSEDPVMVDLWSAEWALRPGTFSTVEPGEVCRLKNIVEDTSQRPAARARILQAAAERTKATDNPWYVKSAGKILEQTNLAQLSESAGLSQVIYASLRVAQKYPGNSSAPDLEKWLRAAPSIAEYAALALREIDPELEREAVRRTIANTDTPEQTRAFLTDHLRRMDLAEY